MYYFNQKDLGFAKIPSFSVPKNDFLRIEIDTSLNQQVFSISHFLFTTLKYQGFIKIANNPSFFVRNNPFNNQTVNDFFSYYKLSEMEISTFFDKAAFYGEKIYRSTKMKNLTTQQYRVVSLQGLQKVDKPLIICTVGMYLSILRFSYDLMKLRLIAGGTILEIAYPYFSDGEDLGTYVVENPKVIRLSKA